VHEKSGGDPTARRVVDGEAEGGLVLADSSARRRSGSHLVLPAQEPTSVMPSSIHRSVPGAYLSNPHRPESEFSIQVGADVEV
jgi:hypothetical protein